MTEAEQFNAALSQLKECAGWEQYYSICAESYGQLHGAWYYHSDGYFTDQVAIIGTHKGYPDMKGHTHRLTDAQEEQLYEDINAGLVYLARVPHERHTRSFPFSYVY